MHGIGRIHRLGLYYLEELQALIEGLVAKESIYKYVETRSRKGCNEEILFSI